MSDAGVEIVTPSMQASIDLLNRMVSKIPFGSTLRRVEDLVPEASPIEEDEDPEPFRKALPRPGPWPCVAKCGATAATPGVCEACGDKAAREEAEEEFRAAIDSIPTEFRWARVESPDLDVRCGRALDRRGIEIPVSTHVVPRIVSRILGRKTLTCLLRGVNDAGKTSLACAVMQTIVERGIREWIVFARKRPGSRLAQAPREPEIITLARGARFVSARDVLPMQTHGAEHVASRLEMAKAATILVLDDIGEELPKIKGVFSAAERTQAMINLVAHRWDAGRATIGTTTRTNGMILRLYDEGTHKRLVASNRVRIIELEKRS